MIEEIKNVIIASHKLVLDNFPLIIISQYIIVTIAVIFSLLKDRKQIDKTVIIRSILLILFAPLTVMIFIYHIITTDNFIR